MVTRTNGPPVDWTRFLSGFGVLLVAAGAFFGLLRGVFSQIVLFSQYESLVEAELYRPSILPCLVALAAAGAGAVMWWLAFVKRRVWRSGIIPCLVVALGALVVAGVVSGPSEQELERKWAERLERLQLPVEFRPVPVDPALTSDRYEVSRHWATEQQPQQACGAVQRALESWLGSVSVVRAASDGCYLSAIDRDDSVSASFLFPGVEDPGPTILEVRIAYAL